MKVLVTGGAGFIGSNLCAALLSDPAFQEVRVIDDFSTGYRSNLEHMPVDLIEGSILDDRALTRASAGMDAIVHLAALGSVPRSVADPERTHEVNATGTLKVLMAARKNGSYTVLASSSSVYGANRELPKHESMRCEPISPYAVSKSATEQYAVAFRNVYDLETLPFRFFNVYGPRQSAGHAYAAVIPVFTRAALLGEALPINGTGLQSRDFTYVDTVTETIRTALLQRICSGPVNLAVGSRTTLLDIVQMLETHLGVDLRIDHRDARPGDVSHSQASGELFRSLFPTVSSTKVEDGLRETLDWMRSVL